MFLVASIEKYGCEYRSCVYEAFNNPQLEPIDIMESMRIVNAHRILPGKHIIYENEIIDDDELHNLALYMPSILPLLEKSKSTKESLTRSAYKSYLKIRECIKPLEESQSLLLSLKSVDKLSSTDWFEEVSRIFRYPIPMINIFKFENRYYIHINNFRQSESDSMSIRAYRSKAL